MSTEHIQTVIVGSGVVGIAIARKLANLGHEVLVLEAEESGLHHTSARNSQVIHVGMYYAPNSLKAKLCVQGHKMLYDFCETRHVVHVRCGKLIIASSAEQIPALEELRIRGIENGLDNLEVISADAAETLEPELKCAGALLSPSTGTVDAPSFMNVMLGEAEASGAVFAYHAPLKRVDIRPQGFVLDVGGEHPMSLTCNNFINAAGLGAWDVARNTKGYGLARVPHQTYAKACYFSLKSGKAPFERLIYPVPGSGSLGVHSLRDISGQVRFGPSLSYLDPPMIDYRHDARPEPFEAAVRAFWPALPENSLRPDTTGIRPRTTRPGEPLADFKIDGEQAHGVPGLVQLFGIESPGLTSSLAIAKYVATLI